MVVAVVEATAEVAVVEVTVVEAVEAVRRGAVERTLSRSQARLHKRLRHLFPKTVAMAAVLRSAMVLLTSRPPLRCLLILLVLRPTT